MNILNGAKCLLPKFKIGGNIKLIETGIKMSLKRVWIIQIDRVRLI
jgi:hypothetical protein